MYPLITLTTDFGTRDSYVGAMKGVILSICPDAQLVDITHEIPPQNIVAAAFVLRAAVPHFPPHTVHLVVVDPGVGSDRQPVALATPLARYVGPNNGVFGPLWQPAASDVEAVLLSERRFWRSGISATFHGRDIFAPVAAYLAAGVPLATLGPALPSADLLSLPLPEPATDEQGGLRGEVVYIDHFGNCISNINADHLAQLGPLPELVVLVAGQQLVLQPTYAAVAPGAALALLGSDGYLEVAVREGHASNVLNIIPGTPLQVRHLPAHG